MELIYRERGVLLRGPLHLELASPLERTLRPVQITSDGGPITIEPPFAVIDHVRLLGHAVIVSLTVRVPHGELYLLLEVGGGRLLLGLEASEAEP